MGGKENRTDFTCREWRLIRIDFALMRKAGITGVSCVHRYLVPGRKDAGSGRVQGACARRLIFTVARIRSAWLQKACNSTFFSLFDWQIGQNSCECAGIFHQKPLFNQYMEKIHAQLQAFVLTTRFRSLKPALPQVFIPIRFVRQGAITCPKSSTVPGFPLLSERKCPSRRIVTLH